MEFWFGKIFWAIFAPSHLAVLLLIAFGFLDFPGWMRSFFISFAAFFLWMMMIFPLGDWALLPLEQCEENVQLPLTVDGILVLGGILDEEPSVTSGDAQFNSAADRFIGMLRLMKNYPQAAVVYSGGSSSVKFPDFHEADAIQRVMDSIGIDSGRVIFENRARNTMENVERTQALFSAKPGQNWLVVTSAYHLPRALSLFRAVGQKTHTSFYPYATDFKSPQRFRPEFTFDLPNNLAKLDMAAKEYVALVFNRLVGRSHEFMPCGMKEERL
ncbi:MAG: YdcF family protein [Proteobacteria bacterium]|nr:YdcF family protein [Pseudomonadota bacterium]